MSDWIAFAPEQSEPAPITIELHSSGPDGPPPPSSPTGPTSEGYYFRQAEPMMVWDITHALGRYPSVTAQTSGPIQGSGAGGVVLHTSQGHLYVKWAQPEMGVVYLAR